MCFWCFIVKHCYSMLSILGINENIILE
jgi:hypothetical protein